jgi:hypothetical protein
MADLTPHPLVTRVGLGLLEKSDVRLRDPATTAADSLTEEQTSAAAAGRFAAQVQAGAVAATARKVAEWLEAQEAADAARSVAEAAAAEAGQGEDPGKYESGEAARTPEQEAEAATAEEQRKHGAQTADQAAKEAEEAADKAAEEARNALVSMPASPAGSSAAYDPIDVDDLHLSQKEALAAALADKSDLPDLTLFAGFIGGRVDRGEDGEWRLVYLDSRLFSWLLVRESDILVHQRLSDEHAPSGMRDVLWIRGTANVIQGTGARSNEGRFLVGEFTRAGDFAASTTGGTFSAASGLLCEATTPGCCIPRRTG